MSLITSISGIRGTIGGKASEGLHPINLAEFTAAYAAFIRKSSPIGSNKIVVGRDARMSGDMVKRIVIGTLQACGFDVVDIDLATTPTTELAVVHEKADGGVILTASHNPRQWNALKLLNHHGEFLSATEGEQVLELAKKRDLTFVDVDHLGQVTEKSHLEQHIVDVLALPTVDVEAIRAAKFKVVADTINSVGSIALPPLFRALGVEEVHLINDDTTGNFAHNPEPLPGHLTDLSRAIVEHKADVGFAVDPDVDRLAIFCEDGAPFGEEYTLVAIADHLLESAPMGSSTASNLSSSRALRDVTERHGGKYYSAAVGEVNVTTKMKEVGAIIGGEGNGGVIYPAAHYGRDALVGIALFLTLLAKRQMRPSEVRRQLPNYEMVKDRIELTPGIDVDHLLDQIRERYEGRAQITTIDGVKLDFPDRWVHLRKSNTEPIVRIYAEADSEDRARALAAEIHEIFEQLTH
ncbi:MAG: phosphoglucosamine mutase [Porphyromonas sp.]|nr:phosphoglucosamine mutase [Porphyromonas sp.]